MPALRQDIGLVSPLRLRWVKVYSGLGVTCHLHIRQNDRGLLGVIAVTWGWNGHRYKVNSAEKNSPAAPAGIRTRVLSIESPASYQQATPAPELCDASGNVR